MVMSFVDNVSGPDILIPDACAAQANHAKPTATRKPAYGYNYAFYFVFKR
jgi:hypothetical protein